MYKDGVYQREVGACRNNDRLKGNHAKWSGEDDGGNLLEWLLLETHEEQQHGPGIGLADLLRSA